MGVLELNECILQSEFKNICEVSKKNRKTNSRIETPEKKFVMFIKT
jgi:hypothetical protein